MENDIFMERKIGELCLKKMALKSFSCDFDYILYWLRISILGYLFFVTTDS
jgi:hypothetical protein